MADATEGVPVAARYSVAHHWRAVRGTARREPRRRKDREPWHVRFEDGDSDWWTQRRLKEGRALRQQLDADAPPELEDSGDEGDEAAAQQGAEPMDAEARAANARQARRPCDGD